MENKFKRDKIYIAGVRYFDKEHNGIELGDNLTYVIVAKKGRGKKAVYYNVFDNTETYPVFKRSKYYSNYTKNGEAYGTKMVLRSGKATSGPCWILEEKLSEDKFDEEITINELEELMIESDKYFKDRKNLIYKRVKKNPIKMLKKISQDKLAEEDMNYYFLQRQVQKIKRR